MTERNGRDAGADLSARLRDLQMADTTDMVLDDVDPVDEKPDITLINPDDGLEDQDLEPLASECPLTSA